MLLCYPSTCEWPEFYVNHKGMFCSVTNKAQLPTPWGGVLRYFHINVGLAHFGGFEILNLKIFWGFQKNEYFMEYKDFVDILGLDNFWRSMPFRVRYKMTYFWGYMCICLIIPDIFLVVNSRCWVQAYREKKNLEYPHELPT